MAELIPFEPDWQRPFRVEHSYRTEIIVSRGQQEQRIAGRQLPRKTVEYDVKLSRGNLARFHAYLAKNQQGSFWVPDWSRWVSPDATVVTGTDEITVAEVPGWVFPGQQLLLREQIR